MTNQVTHKPTLVLMAGLPGAGKTTLASALGRILHWPVIDKDLLKSTLLALQASEELAGPASYELLFAIAEELLVNQRLSLILDSPALYLVNVERARAIVHAADAQLKVVLCRASRLLRNQRLGSRISRAGQITQDLSTLDDDLLHYSHLPADLLVVHTVNPPEECVQMALSYIMH
jgi:predicted kinase